MKVVGERNFPDSKQKIKNYIKRMPYAEDDQKILAKSRGVWQNKNNMPVGIDQSEYRTGTISITGAEKP